MPPPVLPTFFILAYFVLLQFLKLRDAGNDFPAFPFHLFSQIFFVLICIIRVLDMCKTHDVIDRLGLTGIAEPNGGRDYYHYIASFPIKFWYLTGETLQTFGEVVVDMRMSIILHDRTYRRNRVRRRIRVQRLNITNRLLLVFIWLRRYLRMQTLAMMFKVDITYVSKTIQEIVSLLLEKYSRQVVWPTLAEWRGWLGHWKKFPSCVGIIDATTHPIWRPSQRQAMFYRGDKKKHFMSSHIIVTPDGMIVHCSAAFPGHLNDTNGFNMMPRIGPQCALDLPAGCHIISDNGYPPHPALIKPKRRAQVNGNPRLQEINGELTSCRIKVEHAIGFFKTYRCISERWRHPRAFLPIVIHCCASLSNRRLRFLQNTY